MMHTGKTKKSYQPRKYPPNSTSKIPIYPSFVFFYFHLDSSVGISIHPSIQLDRRSLTKRSQFLNFLPRLIPNFALRFLFFDASAAFLFFHVALVVFVGF